MLWFSSFKKFMMILNQMSRNLYWYLKVYIALIQACWLVRHEICLYVIKHVECLFIWETNFSYLRRHLCTPNIIHVHVYVMHVAIMSSIM